MLTGLLLLAAVAGQTADPIAPARAGKYQCVMPNVEKRTCMGTTRYRFDGDRYESATAMFLAPTPLITMRLRTTGTVRNGQLCETVRLADFQAGDVMMNGKAADGATADAVKSQMTAAVRELDGKSACSAIKPAEGGMLLNEVSIDGAVRADLSQKFIWVSESDGYTLGM